MSDEIVLDPAADKKIADAAGKIAVVVNPEDVVGIKLEPTFISLGISQAMFKKEVGGIPEPKA